MFNGYLLKHGNESFPCQYINSRTWKSTPSKRTDSGSYYDSLGRLHRGITPHDRTEITFTTHIVDLAGKQAIQNFFSGATINARERKCRLTYWNDEDNAYKTGDFYIPDITFTVRSVTSDNIFYDELEIRLIEY